MDWWEVAILVGVSLLIYPAMLVVVGAMLGPASGLYGEHVIESREGSHDHD